MIKPLQETPFGKILEEVQKFSLSKNPTVLTSDRWAQTLLAIVFTIGLFFLGSYWFISPDEAIRRSLSLIILACPCAMAFGTPLALALSLKRAQKKGLIIRDASVFEKAQKIKTIFIDKTGTLTSAEMSLQQDSQDIPTVYQKIILALENESFHPLAFAFRKAFSIPDYLPPVDQLREIPGVGVSGYLFGKHYEIKKNSDLVDQTSCSLYEDDKELFSFVFDTALKSNVLTTLQELRKRYRVCLISGDSKETTFRLAEELQFSKDDVFAECSPEKKAEIVAATADSLMVGDGINDSLALIKSKVGIAANGGVESALKAAAIYMAKDDLRLITEFLRISHQAYQLIRQNLTLSIVYNSIGGVLALMGWINPFIAAILMPISSSVILIGSYLKGRQ